MENLLIACNDLLNKLREKKNMIGINSKNDLIASLLATLATGYAAFLSFCEKGYCLDTYLHIIFTVIFLAYTSYVGYNIFFVRYDYHDLFNEIKDLDKMQHRFSLIIIKDGYNQYSNKFLLRYDDRWNCWLLPYYKTADKDNEIVTINRLKNDLHLSSEIELIKSRVDITTKFSYSANRNKTYEHTYYEAKLSCSDTMKEKEFIIDSVKYKWFSIDDMRKDADIIKKNADALAVLEVMP